MSKPRQTIVGHPHHVILRGNNRRRLFSYPSECQLFLSLLRKALLRNKCMLHAAALMSNHIHLLLTPLTPSSLTACIHSVAQRYAVLRNERRKGSGKLFEERFKSFPIEDEKHIAVVTAYIDLNARAAGRNAQKSWIKWSTWGHHIAKPKLSRLPADMLILSQWYMSLSADPVRRANIYEKFAEDYFARRLEIKYLQRHEEELAKRFPSDTRRYERPNGTQAT